MQSGQTNTTNDRRPLLLAIARAREAQVFLVETMLTRAEAERLDAVLGQLIEVGAIAFYRLGLPLGRARRLQNVIVFLREQVGAMPVDAVQAAAGYASTPTPKPDMLVPVWAFEPLASDPDVLVASGLFAGQPIEFEALPVEHSDPTVPLPRVAGRFASWRLAAGRGVMLGTAALPGREGAYAVFASMRAG